MVQRTGDVQPAAPAPLTAHANRAVAVATAAPPPRRTHRRNRPALRARRSPQSVCDACGRDGRRCAGTKRCAAGHHHPRLAGLRKIELRAARGCRSTRPGLCRCAPAAARSRRQRGPQPEMFNSARVSEVAQACNLLMERAAAPAGAIVGFSLGRQLRLASGMPCAFARTLARRPRHQPGD